MTGSVGVGVGVGVGPNMRGLLAALQVVRPGTRVATGTSRGASEVIVAPGSGGRTVAIAGAVAVAVGAVVAGAAVAVAAVAVVSVRRGERRTTGSSPPPVAVAVGACGCWWAGGAAVRSEPAVAGRIVALPLLDGRAVAPVARSNRTTSAEAVADVAAVAAAASVDPSERSDATAIPRAAGRLAGTGTGTDAGEVLAEPAGIRRTTGSVARAAAGRTPRGRVTAGAACE